MSVLLPSAIVVLNNSYPSQHSVGINDFRLKYCVYNESFRTSRRHQRTFRESSCLLSERNGAVWGVARSPRIYFSEGGSSTLINDDDRRAIGAVGARFLTKRDLDGRIESEGAS